MTRHDHIVCKKCHGENNVGSRFCWYCGGPLRGRPPRSLAQAVAFDGKELQVLAAHEPLLRV